MKMRLLGWAGVQLAEGDSALVIDPLADAGAVWAAAGERAREVPLPEVVAAAPAGSAAVGRVTHLHRDHADAAALSAALTPGAPVLVPAPYGGTETEEASVTQAARELAAAGLAVEPLAPWQSLDVGGWSITALPAADGLGDPQVSWLVSRGGVTIVHAGDTLTHGWWWRVAARAPTRVEAAFLPVNGARIAFPHRRPVSPLRAVMDATEAAVAARILRARCLVPIHYGAYDFPPVYVPDPEPVDALSHDHDEFRVLTPTLGEWVTLAATTATAGP
jgi:L-ascorbate metabolism protein UlaG (beta-lactamase superfamily)